MSRLFLWDAVRAPLQENEETMYDAFPRAFVAGDKLFYYRVSDFYRDWIQVFTHTGESLGSYRTLSQFLAETRKSERRKAAAKSRSNTAEALLREIRPLVGHRIVAIEVAEDPDGLFPFTVFVLDDGRQVILQSDPEGNGGGFPSVAKPASPQT